MLLKTVFSVYKTT